MKIAYIISAHRLPEQLIRLVKRLNTETDRFLIHVDQKTDPRIYQQLVTDLKPFPNVHFLKRHRCHWGDFGHVQATIKGLNTLFTQNWDFDYIILLTGQDYPLKSPAQIHQFLQEGRGNSYMSHRPLPLTLNPNDLETCFLEIPPHQRPEYRQFYEQNLTEKLYRINGWHFFNGAGEHFSWPPREQESPFLYKIWSKIGFLFPQKRTFPPGFKPYVGRSYWCISQEVAAYLHQFINRNPQFVRFFKTVYIPDEYFFQTILMNSPFREKIINHFWCYMRWPPPDRLTDILTKKDFELLINTPEIFARKFDITVDSEILDRLDDHLNHHPA